MRAPEVDPAGAPKLGWYAAVGIMALALSLAGLLGGHQLLGAAFGNGDPEEVLPVPAVEASQCPEAMEAADACDYDGPPARADRKGPVCGAVHHERLPATPARDAAAGATAARR